MTPMNTPDRTVDPITATAILALIVLVAWRCWGWLGG